MESPVYEMGCEVRAVLIFMSVLASGLAVGGTRPAQEPAKKGRWDVTGPILTPGPAGAFDDVAVKDPSFVRFNGKYHVFYTSKPRKGESAHETGLGYVCAPTLEGPWERLEAGANHFLAGAPQLAGPDGQPVQLHQVSHPELIRSGYDQRLEVDDYKLRMVFQVFDASNTPDSFDSDLLPWALYVGRNY